MYLEQYFTDKWPSPCSPTELPTHLIPQPLCGQCGMLFFFLPPCFSPLPLFFSPVCLLGLVKTWGVVVLGNCGQTQRNKHHIPRRGMSKVPHYPHTVFSFGPVLHTTVSSWFIMLSENIKLYIYTIANCDSLTYSQQNMQNSSLKIKSVKPICLMLLVFAILSHHWLNLNNKEAIFTHLISLRDGLWMFQELSPTS